MANIYRMLTIRCSDGWRSKANNRAHAPGWVSAAMLAMWLVVLPESLLAQSGADFKVEVLIADQGQKQRENAYWLALDSLLRRDMPNAVTDADQRSKVLREASRYVQSFRYRKFDPATDSGRLSTRKVREGDAVDSVIAVTFPSNLEGILRQQSAPVAVLEESADLSSGNILALIAVDQQTSQFLIGGTRGKKFQSRMAQLGAANALSFEFPALDRNDKELISPADVLYDQVDRLDAMMTKYQANRRLSGSLFRLSEKVWQTEWRYLVPGQPLKTLNLTTATLDEALVTALSELGNSGTGYRADSYLGQRAAFQRDGVGLRVENINSTADYQRVLAVLQQVDGSFVTESLEAGAIVFRAPTATSFELQRSLARVSQLRLLTTSTATGTADLVAQYVGR